MYDNLRRRERSHELRKPRHHGFPHGFEVVDAPLAFGKPPWAEDINVVWAREAAMAAVPGRVQRKAERKGWIQKKLKDLERERLGIEFELDALKWRARMGAGTAEAAEEPHAAEPGAGASRVEKAQKREQSGPPRAEESAPG